MDAILSREEYNKTDWIRGLEGDSDFSYFNPWVTTLYYLLVGLIVMTTRSPVILGASLIFGFIYGVMQNGRGRLKSYILITILVLVLSSCINGFFTHNGETVLFYVGANRITKEAFCYGGIMALMVISMILILSSYSAIMTSDKLIYVFGKFAPVIGLIISMIFRFIPLLRNRMDEIRMGAKSLGRTEVSSLVPKAREGVKETSTLISWSLEASIESADSMAARGYGLKGRTSFHLFKVERRDILFAIIVFCLGVITLMGNIRGITDYYFYPGMRWGENARSTRALISYLSYGILLLIPIVMDVYGEAKWKR